MANLLLDCEEYRSGKLVRYGNISPNSQLPEMVIHDKIALGAAPERAAYQATGGTGQASVRAYESAQSGRIAESAKVSTAEPV